MLATIPASMPAKRFPLEACSALIISKYAPWLMRSSGYSCPATPPYQICGSWVGLLPKLLVGGAFDSILPSAVITLGLSISCNDTLRRGPTSTLARTHCLALSLLRKSLLRADGPFQTDLVAASMCLSLAEVRSGPQTTANVNELVADELHIVAYAANLRRRIDGTS